MDQGKKRIRVLLAKMGLDGHDRGILMVLFALRDAGMEVTYTGLGQTPLAVAQAALQENVDLIGVSSLADAHRTLVPKLIHELKQLDSDIPVILGGFIQPEDMPQLEHQGVKKVFPLNARLDDIVDYIKKLALARAG